MVMTMTAIVAGESDHPCRQMPGVGAPRGLVGEAWLGGVPGGAPFEAGGAPFEAGDGLAGAGNGGVAARRRCPASAPLCSSRR
jgi:hypothetical protein